MRLCCVAHTDHAGYLTHWTRMLRAQPAVLWTVAIRAQAATDWLAAYSTTPADLAGAGRRARDRDPPGYRQALNFVAAVSVVAAGLRDGHTVTVAAADERIRWALAAAGRIVDVEPINPDLFALDPTPRAWVERLAATAAALL